MAATDHTHTISLVVRDKPGVLVRIALVFARRGFNIESLSVSPGAIEGFSRMTITSNGTPGVLEQIVKHLSKLVDVVFATDHGGDDALEEEVALVKLRANADGLAGAVALARERGASVVHQDDGRVILCCHGGSEAIDGLLSSLEHDHVEEIVRSGKIVIDRGESDFADLLGGAPKSVPPPAR
ncbi:MAG: acetolactate synthase small subunit [Myxococcales bacterium]|nr:acetolactate synthase small subunit [Myxococcales bacterium]